MTDAQNLQVASLLIRRTQKLARRTGLPFFRIDSSQQRGATFGERLSHALSEVFARGYRHVVCIGNDCPALSHRQLLHTARQVAAGKLAIGADHNGGLYLIGLSDRQFFASELAGLPWQSGLDACAVQQYATVHHFELYTGPLLRDIDSWCDLVYYLRILTGIQALRRLRHLLHACLQVIAALFFLPLLIPHHLHYLRGPPVRILA